MDLNEYQETIKKFYLLRDTQELELAALGLSGEAGEAVDKVKKLYRGDFDDIPVEERTDAHLAIAKELGDVLFYVSTMATLLDMPMSVIAQTSVEKLESRIARDKITGDGDDR